MTVWVNESCAVFLFIPAVKPLRGDGNLCSPSGMTVKGKVHAHGRRFLAALFWDGLFNFFQGYKTQKPCHVSDTMNMDDSESRCRREAHGREPYKGHTGEQPPRMVGRLHSSPVAYMDRMGTVLTSAGA